MKHFHNYGSRYLEREVLELRSTGTCIYFERLVSECIILASINVEVNKSVIFHLASVKINQCSPLINFKSADRTETQENASEKYNIHCPDIT